jgi:hypothetical protein
VKNPFFHVLGFLIYVGAREMQRRGSYRWAVAASVLAMIPSHFGAVLGIPFGIWSLILLRKPQTRSEFKETGNFAPEIESARNRGTAALKRGSTILQAVPWKAVFSRVSPATGIRWVRTTAGAGFRLMLWTITCMLTFAVAVLLVAQFGAWKVQVTDRSAYRIEGDSGRFDIRATGSVWQTGAAYAPETLIRDEISIALWPNVADGRKAVEQDLIISVASMEYRTSSQLDADAKPFDSDTILDWMKSVGVEGESAAVKQEAACLTDAVYEVADDPSHGVTDDREFVQLIGRNIFTKGRSYSNFVLKSEAIPDVVPMAMACAVNAILWLTGIAIIVVNAFRRSESENDGVGKSRLKLLAKTVVILTLWCAVAYLARPIVATFLPRALASEFPKEFTANNASAALISDLVVGVVWTAGVIVISLPAWVLWRSRGPRQLTDQSDTADATSGPAIPADAAPVAATSELTEPVQQDEPAHDDAGSDD